MLLVPGNSSARKSLGTGESCLLQPVCLLLASELGNRKSLSVLPKSCHLYQMALLDTGDCAQTVWGCPHLDTHEFSRQVQWLFLCWDKFHTQEELLAVGKIGRAQASAKNFQVLVKQKKKNSKLTSEKFPSHLWRLSCTSLTLGRALSRGKGKICRVL